MAETGLYGGIELGGTKTLVAVGAADGRMFARATLPTTTPDALMPQIAAFFADHTATGDLSGLGVGAFGPIVIDPAADDYGHLLETNKPGWSGFDLVGALQGICTAPVTLVTDVAAAGLAEARLGALRGVDLGIYLTIGTGIGGAVLYRGQVLPALLHPEMGHLPIQPQPDDPAGSICRFHGSCAEGLAAGPAIMARFGAPLSAFASGSPEHQLIADYLGQLCATLVLALSPQRIVIGGGVGKTPGLIDAVQAAMLRQLGGYAGRSAAYAGYLRAPALDQDAGIVGAICCGAYPDSARQA